MLRTILPFIFVCVVGMIAVRSSSQSQGRPIVEVPISADDLNKCQVIGKLDLPLGTVTEIEATIIAGDQLNQKRYAGEYLLHVTSVAGHLLKESRFLEFSVPQFISAKLAHDPFDLYEMTTGKKISQLDSAQIAKIDEGYVGKHVRLDVYETGIFSGIPDNLPKDVHAWADHGFGFTSNLVVLAERE
jgi:hypothetical protein